MNCKKVFRSLAAVLLVALMTVPVAAAADITIDGVGTEYSLYRLMDLDARLKALDDPCHVNDKNGEHTIACYNYAYTVNDTYVDVLKQAVPEDIIANGFSDAEIISYLGRFNSNGDGIRSFADTVYELVKDMEPEAWSDKNVFKDMPQGYYLIVESGSLEGSDSRSLVMLDTLGQKDIVVTAKEDVPTIKSEVLEINDSNGVSEWQNSADCDIGDSAYFRLTSNVPEFIGDYSAYEYTFCNAMDNLTLDKDTVKVAIDGIEVDKSQYSITDGEDSFEVRLNDILKIADKIGLTLAGGSQVILEYSAVLNETAVLGSEGNSNKSWIRFSNDPYNIGSAAVTSKAETRIFSYKLTVNSSNKEHKPVYGTGFDLLKFNGTEYVPYKTIESTQERASFDFTGLDFGKYKLVERVVPFYFDKMDDIEFEIVSDKQKLVVKNTDGTIVSGEGKTFTVDSQTGMKIEVVHADNIRICLCILCVGFMLAAGLFVIKCRLLP